MEKLIDAFPDLFSELTKGLFGRQELIDQLKEAIIVYVTFDEDADAGCIKLQTGRELNVVEQNIIGVKHGQTLAVKCQYWVNLDTDNFERIAAIEIVAPPQA
jgi:hypothetical protein